MTAVKTKDLSTLEKQTNKQAFVLVQHMFASLALQRIDSLVRLHLH